MSGVFTSIASQISCRSTPCYSQNNLPSSKNIKMQKYQCVVCGYIYDPEQGDPDSGIEPGTAFDDIPDDWACPVCGATKSQFEPMKD